MPAHAIRFGIFEVDAQAGELRKDGRRLKVSGQPLEILSALLQHHGKLITRDELRSRLWPDSTVDFDHGLNAAINKLRASLGDSASRPRFIETLPRRGYRFIAPIERPKLMLAVLPFKNLNRDPEENYFSDGLTQELITHLALLDPQRLGVIAQTSVMQYKQTNKRVHEIGDELAVNYILEGSVRRFGKRVRVAVQLIDAEDETCLWAQTSENHLRDILSVENKIAQIVAKHIQRQVRVGNRPSAPPVEPQAHEAYLRGRHQLRKLTREGAEKALVHFEASIRKDSACAVAYGGLAQAYLSLTTFYLAPLEAMPKAKAAAMKALELDENLAEAHASLGLVRFFYDWDWPGAEREFKRALALNPSLADAHLGYAGFLVSQGRHEEALQETRTSQELDPLPMCSRGEALWHYYVFRQYGEAVRQCRKAIDLEPNFFLAHTIMGWALAGDGRWAEAIAAAETGRHLSDSPFALAGLGFIYAKAGYGAKASDILLELTELSKRRYVCGYHVAIIHAALGEKDRALEWLARAHGERSD